VTVLNACWSEGLLVWAEGGVFECAGGIPEPVTLLVPCAGDVPTPSPEVPLDEPGPEPDGVREQQVTAVRLDASAALDLLREPTEPGTGTTRGVGLRYLATLAGFVADLVRRGRVLPWAVAETPDTARAVWWPMLSGADAARARAFVAAMPDAVRAVSRSGAAGDVAGGAAGAAATVVDALDQLVDATVRATHRTAGGRRPRRGRTSSPDTGLAGVVAAWQQALVGEATFPATPEQLDVLREALTEWHRDASGGPVRAWFRLVEPLDDGSVVGTTDSPASDSKASDSLASGTVVDSDQPWRVELGLQAADEPSLAVAADQVWRSREVLTALARYVPEPQETLLTELGRAYRLWPGLEPALRTARPTRVELDAAGAHAFLTDVAPSLAGAGFGVLLPSWWGQPAARIGVRAAASTPPQPGAVATSSRFGQDALVAFRWELAIGDEVLTQQEIEALAEAKQPLVRIRGQWVNLDHSRLRAGLDLVAAGQRRQLGLGDLLRRVAAGEEDPEDGVPVLGIDADGWLGELLKAGAPEPAAAPEGFAGSLRPYQERGLGWLSFLDRLGLGAILADDMGLGKTVQLLALFLADRAASAEPERSAEPEQPAEVPVGPTLLVCPMSLVGNWRREAARFAPALRVHIHHGAERPRGKAFEAAVAASDLVITTYALVARDAAALRRVPWRRVVLDEAQAVKNAATRAATAVRSLPARHRIAVTGTPVENRLADLWSLMEFANPGLLGGPQVFRRRFSVPVERHADPDAAARLRAVTSPFILRRLKTDRTVIADLPEKLEMEVTCTLTREQASLYQAVVDDMLARIAETTGIERRGLVLATMTKLKQVCNHPAQLLRDASPVPGRSGKLARLEETVEEVLAAGEKALLFTQFAEFGALLRGHLSSRFGREVLFLHGGVGQRERDQMVTRFQSDRSGSPPLFVLSLKAGGTGLTLTAANHVIHVDRWWNPAVEDQASDRAFRIGQTRTVQVRKLVCAGTLEERVSQMIADKRGLAASIVGSGEGWLTELSTEALRELVTLEPGTVVE
jgi:non-specific serine/threonine protein kinase